MKKKGIKNKISRLILSTAMVMGLFASVGAVVKVSAATGPAPTDWAFEESSRPLNDAIVAAYPSLGDANGYVTISSANAMTGTLNLASKNILGTIKGIENFTDITLLLLNNNQFTGNIPENIDNLSSLQKFRLQGNQITGNIPASITNLTNLDELLLFANKLDGEIPAAIGNLSNLTTLRLDSNLLTGTIPTNIGSLTSLVELSLHNNQLTGALPTSIGDLSNLARLNLRNNQLTSEIPQTIGSLSNLVNFNIQDNNISGVLPGTIYTLPLLEKVELHHNIGLTGNPAIGFASSTTLNYLDIRGTSLIQASPEIATLGYTVGTFLYDNLADELLTDSKTNLADGLTQETIDKAQESADFITDPTEKQQWQDDINLAQQMLNAKNKVDTLLVTPGLNDLKPGITINDIDDAQDLVTALPNGSLKDELQAKIDAAKNMTDAKDKVDGLLTTPDLSNLKPGVDANTINDAQDAVNKLPAGPLKDDLQNKIDTAKKLLDAENKVIDLFNPDGSLAAGVDQGKIDDAQKAVNLLPNGFTKDLLQALIDEAQSLLNAKNRETLVVAKPSVVATQNGAVNTSDSVYTSALITLLLSSIAVLGFATKRKLHK